MTSTIVLGAQWGDEGKGKLVDRLAAQAQLVVRFQGGANAGHTVIVGGVKRVQHLVPSGILHPGVVNLIAAGCVIDLARLVEEIDTLAAAGVAVGPENLRLDTGAHVVTPVHTYLDRLQGSAVGTTGRGIGPSYADKASRIGIRLASLLDGTLEPLYRALHQHHAHVAAAAGEPYPDLGADLERLQAAAKRLRPLLTDGRALIRRALTSGQALLFEGAQGTLLDLDHGTYPFVTSSSTTIGGAYTGGGVYVPFERRIGVAKAYCTRVGNGPFPTELADERGAWLRERGHEYGATTGRPRRCGWLDLELLRQAVIINGFTELALTKLDCLTGLDPLVIAVGREADGSPRFQTMAGWHQDLQSVATRADLPETCRRYIELIEQLAGVPVTLISTGPERDQLITPPASARVVDPALGDRCSAIAYGHAQRTFAARAGQPGEVLDQASSFSSLLRLADGQRLAITSDGIGTKVELAERTGRYDTLGWDLIAMVVDDLAASGAVPLALTNILDVDRLDAAVIEQLMTGLERAALEAQIAVAGGEIAELGDRVRGWGAGMHFNWCATAIGHLPDGQQALDGSALDPGDVLVALASRGFRSNGFSLARQVLSAHHGHDWHTAPCPAGGTWGEALLMPARIYCPLVTRLRAAGIVLHGIAHITGGGIPSKLGRILRRGRHAAGLGAHLTALPPEHRSMVELRRLGDLDLAQAYRQWNMGTGMILVLPPSAVEACLRLVAAAGFVGQVAGTISSEPTIVIEHGGTQLTFPVRGEER